MSQPPEQREPTARDYLEHARTINVIAGNALRREGRDALPALLAKISLGLSLQAIELAGKAMLRALGHSVERIRKEHRNHKVLVLLRQAEREIQKNANEALTPYHHFLLWTPTIRGKKTGTTMAEYFENHFARGPSAFPRNYFYPDQFVFSGPRPIEALSVMADDLIEVAGQVIEALRT